jgi:hypothetical protein
VLRGVNDPLCKSLVLGLTPHGMQGVAAGAFVLTSSLGRALGPSVVALSEVCVFSHELGRCWAEHQHPLFVSNLHALFFIRRFFLK